MRKNESKIDNEFKELSTKIIRICRSGSKAGSNLLWYHQSKIPPWWKEEKTLEPDKSVMIH